jgi:uncharacterized membrane protein YpjA
MSGVGARLDGFLARYVDEPIPESRDLPWWLAPLPEWLENVGFRLLWPIVFVNLAGTAFGFWFYWVQLQETPVIMWIIVPVSPLATMYMALSLASWRLDWDAEWLHMLAFFGCLKYGAWVPFVQLYVNGPGVIEPWLYQFLIWSHAAMVVQAFLITRYAEFPVWAVGVATGWYALNDVLDYFVAIFDGPHHTWVTGLRVNSEIDRTLAAFDHTAAFAVCTTILAVFLALALRVELVKRREGG